MNDAKAGRYKSVSSFFLFFCVCVFYIVSALIFFFINFKVAFPKESQLPQNCIYHLSDSLTLIEFLQNFTRTFFPLSLS